MASVRSTLPTLQKVMMVLLFQIPWGRRRHHLHSAKPRWRSNVLAVLAEKAAMRNVGRLGLRLYYIF